MLYGPSPQSQASGDVGLRDYATSDVTVKMFKNHLNLESCPTAIKLAQTNIILMTKYFL